MYINQKRHGNVSIKAFTKSNYLQLFPIIQKTDLTVGNAFYPKVLDAN